MSVEGIIVYIPISGRWNYAVEIHSWMEIYFNIISREKMGFLKAFYAAESFQGEYVACLLKPISSIPWPDDM